jgi:hypothetical protein
MQAQVIEELAQTIIAMIALGWGLLVAAVDTPGPS